MSFYTISKWLHVCFIDHDICLIVLSAPFSTRIFYAVNT